MQKWEYALVWFDGWTKDYGIVEVPSDDGNKEGTCSVLNELDPEKSRLLAERLARKKGAVSVFLFKRPTQE